MHFLSLAIFQNCSIMVRLVLRLLGLGLGRGRGVLARLCSCRSRQHSTSKQSSLGRERLWVQKRDWLALGIMPNRKPGLGGFG